jgi:phosphate transport system ATP-binding protein
MMISMPDRIPTVKKTESVLQTKNLNVYYGDTLALRNINLEIPKNKITAFIGPSGCGKSTLLRCFNRLNDRIENFRLEGKVSYYQQNLYDSGVDPVAIRRRIGMVFQKPNPLPMSIYENIAFGPKSIGLKKNLDELVERSLIQVDLWKEVKNRLRKSALILSRGQQQRLCIARTLAVQPEAILMDEPCSALDPISTLTLEEILQELKQHYTIVLVTHNMQQASRLSDMTAFFNVEFSENHRRVGYLVEYDETPMIFLNPAQSLTRQYIRGRFG